MIATTMRSAAFAGEHVGADVVRLALVSLGITLALLVLRVVWLEVRQGLWIEACGAAAFACFLAAPAAIGLLRFGEPLLMAPAAVYAVGMTLAAIAILADVVISPPWFERLGAPPPRKPTGGCR